MSSTNVALAPLAEVLSTGEHWGGAVLSTRRRACMMAVLE